MRAQAPGGGGAGTAGGGASVSVPESAAFLRILVPKEKLVVGELVPVTVKAYFRAGTSASLNGLPILGSDAFSLGKLDEHPEQSHETVKGESYTVLTWKTTLSAVKAGDYPLKMDLPVLLRVMQKRAHGSHGRNPFKDFFGDNSPFGDSFFDDSFFDDFFAQAEERPVTLHSEGSTIKIAALPTRGRPANFSGAVGHFEIGSGISTAKATTGDPLTLTLTINGRGNFDRVTTPGLPGSAEWKTYKPSAQFEPAGAVAGAGSKTFSQAVIPQKAGAQQIPPVSFSYFDPETQQYVTKQSSAIPLEVAQGVVAPAATGPAAESAPIAARDELAPDEAIKSDARGTLRPLVLTPWFLAVNAAMLAALAIGGILRIVRRRRASDPARVERETHERAAAAQLAAMDAAERKNDVPAFFQAASRALQEKLALRWQIPVARVTPAEVRARLDGGGEELNAIFRTADQLTYAGGGVATCDLQGWRAVIERQLRAISQA